LKKGWGGKKQQKVYLGEIKEKVTTHTWDFARKNTDQELLRVGNFITNLERGGGKGNFQSLKRKPEFRRKEKQRL